MNQNSKSEQSGADNSQFSVEKITARQGEVLAAALELLTQEGDSLTMNGVARAAACSKESLYKWFGDRSGLLTAIVQWQAAKVRRVPIDQSQLTRASFQTGIAAFAENYLSVLNSDSSVALNRVAVSHAGSKKSELGDIVLAHGRLEMGRRLKPVLEAGRAAGFLRFEDSETAFQCFFGLVVRDVQIRRMLGDALHLSEAEIARQAKEASEQFLVLFGARE